MKYLISFTDTAKCDLRDIAIYIAEQSKNKDIAKAFVKELADQCVRLEEQPLIGAMPKDRVLVSCGYRFIVHKEYLIFYSVDESEKKVYIQAGFNAKKDYTRVFKKIV
jgi:plasmid stabilization system protein ParE